ncbi:hypothetical protein [Paenibacillus macquariensis]|uniref:Tetratricopeptide repeat protein n=1 Tax=Paenibacillus macquariensis TaxID=948756 RepID=A0ABY1KEZ4_9BACL|nr:hypothetical protein [Paenibacillus macquariensis]MEC0094372.1 hypothetical protein [Paenibacillus macquariensis]OAB34972.1 hypothetical protein PMSM_10890 [Paenibacillus macquariensis subsp. macquariensis]SIR73778.1 hypothetical protein SAMN05421578_1544 [Paenibacillus macquariensis]
MSRPPKIKQELNRLERLGLVEPHEALKDEVSYQVHPLLREFVHGIYSLKDQQSYVQKVLYIFLPRKLVDALFIDYYSLGEIEEMKPIDLMDSIETCLLSRNIERALGLLEQYKDVLIDKGYHHKFQSLACRILDEINWEDNNIFNRGNGVKILGSIIQQLNYMGENQQSYYYLKKYESAVEPNTIAYLDFLELAADIGWRDGQYKKTIDYTNEYEVLSEKLQTTRNVSRAKYTRALAFRDSGERVTEALMLFDSMDEELVSSHALVGNKARCYYILKNYSKAEELLNKSLFMLLSETSYYAHSNLGFAYLWLVELMYDQGKIKESRAFFNLVQDVWLEYAPGLISKADLVKEKYRQNSEWNNIEVSLSEAKNIESNFLNSKVSIG